MFIRWYNNEHRHSAIRYVTPAHRHEGKDVDMSYEFPPGKLRDWAYRDAHNRILTDDPPNSHNTELYNARKSLGI